MADHTTRIYLDNNATTRPADDVVAAIGQHFQQSFANPGSRHAEGRVARRALEDARESIAAILGAEPTEVVFTSGGTEASNLALFGATQSDPGTILLTAGEHPATTESCKALERRGWKLFHLPVDEDGLLIADHWPDLPWQDVRLATVILAHNETGVIQDLQPLAEHCWQHQVYFHVDAVQAAGKIPVNFHELGAASLAIGAHKFHGPRGIGALLVRQDVQLAPYEFGGHQEAGRRPGTELTALAVGMARALELWQAAREQRTQYVRERRDQLEAALIRECPPAVVNGSRKHRLPNTLNIAFPGLEGEALLVALDLAGIACSLGSTCASGSAEPAPALVAMNCPPEVYKSAVRFSVSIDNTKDEIDEAALRIIQVVQRLRNSGTRNAEA